ncbi:uncharacterized protein DNG_08526 [Cephalotrichum gorgonifer]|uniref:Uncharacterized protein n=1 Tax=Cephalotrichum gorgonifer TaxID=2041049 RepID=A0AAE8N5A0_9PEZI|nr:uncharacterized protein DNG_08526 [Cephalotrichum gorgonifer]
MLGTRRRRLRLETRVILITRESSAMEETGISGGLVMPLTPGHPILRAWRDHGIFPDQIVERQSLASLAIPGTIGRLGTPPGMLPGLTVEHQSPAGLVTPETTGRSETLPANLPASPIKTGRHGAQAPNGRARDSPRPRDSAPATPTPAPAPPSRADQQGPPINPARAALLQAAHATPEIIGPLGSLPGIFLDLIVKRLSIMALAIPGTTGRPERHPAMDRIVGQELILPGDVIAHRNNRQHMNRVAVTAAMVVLTLLPPLRPRPRPRPLRTSERSHRPQLGAEAIRVPQIATLAE